MPKKSDRPSNQKPIDPEQQGVEASASADIEKPARRKALAGGALGAVAWKTPVLSAVVLPAHAQTSVATTAAPTTTATPTTTAAPTTTPAPKQFLTSGASSFFGTIMFGTV